MSHAKTVVPRPPPHFVERADVRELLDAASSEPERGRVILVSAPAGHGKTAAIADWVRATPEVPTAWVSLDAADRDESRWWRTLVSSLAACPAVDPDSALHRLGPAWAEPADRGELLATTLDALEDLPLPVRLVLDDVHEIIGHPSFDGLVSLVRHPLPMLTLVLTSRYDPPLRLDQLRLTGRFGQLRAAQLSFTDADAADLFRREDLDLTDEQVSTLVTRTEGWVAALRLAALSLHGVEDPAGFVAEFAGDDRSVADYLVTEVLSRLSEVDREVLDAACVSSPAPVGLVVALTGRDSAADTLERLEATTAMTTATDRRREHYRVHELLRSHVLARLRRNRPRHLTELHRGCVAWHDQRGDHTRALHHAATAGDVDTLQLLLRTRAIELLSRGEFAALAESERRLADAADDPRVRLVLGLAAFERGDLDRGEGLIDSAEKELASHGGGEHQSDNVIVFRRIVATRVALTRGRLDTAVAVGATIDPDAVDSASLRALALSTRANTLLATDRLRARDDSREALALAEQRRWPYLALQAESTLMLAHTYAGDRDTMTGHAQAVIERAATHDWLASSWTLRARFALASADVLAARPRAALRHVEEAAASCPDGHPHFDAAMSVLRAAIEHDTGRPADAWRRARRARLAGEREQHEDHAVAFAALIEQQAALAAGRVPEAAEVTRAMAPRLAGSAELALLHARDQWAAHDPRARTTLEPALQGRHRALTSLGLVETHLLDARIALSRSELATVHARLRRALALADRFDVLRPLRHLGDELRSYLAEHRGGFAGHDPLVDDALAAAPVAPSPPEHLTDRERAVLELLPTMRSALEIADDLAVSVNTVKTHQRAIYQKLGAANRRDAVARARRFGLLETVPNGHGQPSAAPG